MRRSTDTGSRRGPSTRGGSPMASSLPVTSWWLSSPPRLSTGRPGARKGSLSRRHFIFSQSEEEHAEHIGRNRRPAGTYRLSWDLQTIIHQYSKITLTGLLKGNVYGKKTGKFVFPPEARKAFKKLRPGTTYSRCHGCLRM
jgi:hypothetical protein